MGNSALVVPATAVADVPAYRGSYRAAGPYDYGSDYVRNARDFKRIGIPLTISGAVSIPVGIILSSIGGACWSAGTCDYATSAGLSTLGGVSIVGGVAALGAGIPLWVIGNYRLHRAGYEAFLLQPGFNREPNGGAAGRLSWTLTF